MMLTRLRSRCPLSSIPSELLGTEQQSHLRLMYELLSEMAASELAKNDECKGD